MPTYDYLCDACGHAFEHWQTMTSRIMRTCPECKKRKLRRLIGSGAGVIFKGSGFYETDYKRKSGQGAGQKASESAESSSSKDDAKPKDATSDAKGADSKGSGSKGSGSRDSGSKGSGSTGSGSTGSGSKGAQNKSGD